MVALKVPRPPLAALAALSTEVMLRTSDPPTEATENEYFMSRPPEPNEALPSSWRSSQRPTARLEAPRITEGTVGTKGASTENDEPRVLREEGLRAAMSTPSFNATSSPGTTVAPCLVTTRRVVASVKAHLACFPNKELPALESSLRLGRTWLHSNCPLRSVRATGLSNLTSNALSRSVKRALTATGGSEKSYTTDTDTRTLGTVLPLPSELLDSWL
mmetsp:Transcript_36650/g.74408  ORF Transcript_36650/g.74408 Transcript_36650/m.74408 type:complete len:217 (-) Transcript_36650:383-1033(-)